MRAISCAIMSFICIYTGRNIKLGADRQMYKVKGLFIFISWLFLIASVVLTVLGL